MTKQRMTNKVHIGDFALSPPENSTGRSLIYSPRKGAAEAMLSEFRMRGFIVVTTGDDRALKLLREAWDSSREGEE